MITVTVTVDGLSKSQSLDISPEQWSSWVTRQAAKRIFVQMVTDVMGGRVEAPCPDR